MMSPSGVLGTGGGGYSKAGRTWTTRTLPGMSFSCSIWATPPLPEMATLLRESSSNAARSSNRSLISSFVSVFFAMAHWASLDFVNLLQHAGTDDAPVDHLNALLGPLQRAAEGRVVHVNVRVDLGTVRPRAVGSLRVGEVRREAL